MDWRHTLRVDEEPAQKRFRVRTAKTGAWLVVPLTAVFTFLSIVNTRGVRDLRDAVWIIASLISVGVYAFVTARKERPLLVSMLKLQIILLVSEFIGFGVYVVQSKAIQYNDVAAWLYFYPYLIVSGLIVLCAFPLCFLIVRMFPLGANSAIRR